MKKEELMRSMRQLRIGLKSDSIVETYDQAWNTDLSSQQEAFAKNVMACLVSGIGNYQHFTANQKELCSLLQIAQLYDSETNTKILHHIAEAKSKYPGHSQNVGVFRDGYLRSRETVTFIEAHRRVITTSNLLNKLLHEARPEGELLLEGNIAEGGPSLARIREVLTTIEELVAIYCESQGEIETPKIEISYLDLGSNYQIGIKIDGKAEVGTNLSQLLKEMFRWATNPLGYIQEGRAARVVKEITIIADLQKRIDAGDITVEAAYVFAERLLGCGQKLAAQHVFPAALFKERKVTSPAEDLIKLMDVTAKPPAITAPEFKPLTNQTLLENGSEE